MSLLSKSFTVYSAHSAKPDWQRLLIAAVLLLMVCLVPVSSLQAQSSSLLRSDYPETYEVQAGDTLWNIASQFLVDPERWPDIWRPDPYLDDPDLIFPGDVLSINFVGGAPRMRVLRGGREVEALSPQIRSEPLISSIPAIPLESIENSFTRNRIVTEADYDVAPYIVENVGTNLVIGTGDEVFARGAWPAGTTSFEIYRPSREYVDEEDDDRVSLELEYLGFASIIANEGDDLRRMLINNSGKEIRAGDRLLARETSRIGATIYPAEPSQEVSGRIIAMLNDQAMASQLDTVVVDLGNREFMKIGDVLAVREEGATMVDQVARSRMSLSDRMGAILRRERLNLPGNDIGTLLVYRVFNDFSYALILSSLAPIEMGARVSNP